MKRGIHRGNVLLTVMVCDWLAHANWDAPWWLYAIAVFILLDE